jgi:hypothetical protein
MNALLLFFWGGGGICEETDYNWDNIGGKIQNSTRLSLFYENAFYLWH